MVDWRSPGSSSAQRETLSRRDRQPDRIGQGWPETFDQRSLSDLDFSIAFIPKRILALAAVPFTLFNVFVPSEFRLFPDKKPPTIRPDRYCLSPEEGETTKHIDRAASSISGRDGGAN